MEANTEENPENNTEQLIRGVITRVVYHNPENGYTVTRFRPEGSLQELSVVGDFANPTIGNYFLIRGSHSQHKKFGAQFTAERAIPSSPSTEEEIERYLTSGVIKGIGEKTATKLIQKLGSKALEMIEKDPAKAATLAGVKLKKIQLIASSLSEQTVERESLRFLIEHDISPTLAARIYKTYGPRTVEIVSDNPYRLARDIDGIGFITADQIAAKLGIANDAPQRLEAGLIYTLEKAAESEGHCYLPKQALIQTASNLLSFFETSTLIEGLDQLKEKHLIIEREQNYLLPHLDTAEEVVAKFVAARCAAWSSPKITLDQAATAISQVEADLGITLSTEQNQCVQDCCKYPLMIVTGGPGCGKTTIIRALTRLYKNSGLIVNLTAPTGRAAQRMSQVCDHAACTIHRLLHYDPRLREFTFNAQQNLVADIIIIDEISMIDIQLARNLFLAIAPQTTVILVGDKDQLPSVGPGRVLGDLLALSQIRSIALSKLFRRSQESSITTHAHLINSGQVPEIPIPDGNTKVDAYFIPRELEESANTIEKLVSSQIPSKFGFALEEIQVLSPSNRGPLGVIALNQRLQAVLNPIQDPEAELEIGDNIFRLGDRVCQRVNNYKIDDYGVFNGDIGRVHRVDKKEGQLIIELWDGRLVNYSRAQASELSLGYALTVHRSQGSEIPCVVLALHDSHFTLLHRQLLYTGVTRAKKLLVIVGSKRAFSLACRRTSTDKRLTLLTSRIQFKLTGI